ncbi:MAG TPA: hypothetical protein GXX63_09590 [Tissierellia bacterium]|nr:hypothetical protein [Tissierellia bacterium]
MGNDTLIKEIEKILNKYEDIEHINIEVGYRDKEKDYYYKIKEYEFKF